MSPKACSSEAHPRTQYHLLVEPKSFHQSRQLAFLVESTMTDIDIDQDAAGSGTNTGEEATEGGESAP